MFILNNLKKNRFENFCLLNLTVNKTPICRPSTAVVRITALKLS